MTRLFVNRLTVIDCSLLDSERGLLGESWLVDLELEGRLDAQGMVLDFGRIKRQVKGTIDQRFDHKLLVPSAYPGLQIDCGSQACELRFLDRQGRKVIHRSPADALCLLPVEQITPQAVERAIVQALTAELPDNVEHLAVGVYPEVIQGACYQYSHGLKRHDGNCQRIAHGHRSRLEIQLDGLRSPQLEEAWCERWRDIYIGSREDLQGQTERAGTLYFRFAYKASQGRFELELPGNVCYLIDSDSTVENLARHIAERLAEEHPGHELRVRAFEGVDKGAVAISTGR
jgi:6-pyruvoyl-tetrahydropterin synthase